ncbi:hypothetical protein KUTeg_014363 [Tegillarca granosa]|uniref:AT-rich interactive domain-containing protein 4B n=1 Tax=Tegillarca granosa TaxID=220873 RepID=A0ABQ9EWD3_TEGGR|nr:hypothetical protein KUTeg_014363 [Tegillarca granosa]
MAGNDPPYLNVGTEVSAKYRGAFCEAKVKIIVKKVKCKVLLKESQTSIIVTDEFVKGPLKMGALVEVKHPDSGQVLEATITRMTDSSMYTVVFDDGDERTLRRTQLCLKGDKHFIESETLDNLPLSNPEHFGTPVMGSKKSKGRFSTGNDEDTEDTSSDESDTKRATYKGKVMELLRKVMLVEVGEKKKLTIPVLVVLPDAHQTELKTKDHLLVKSFKDGKFLSVHKKDLKEFVRESALKNEDKPVKAAMEKALMYYDNQDLPSGWDIEELLGIDEDECSDEEESSDDEQTEEKDRFVAQLYKFMDDRAKNCIYILQVTNQLKWRYVYAKMALPQSNQASHQIKNAYKKYLHAFEDFYRKLGCTMGTISRPGRSRNNSGRGMMAFRGQNKEGKKDDELGKESDRDDKKSSDEDSKNEEKRQEECKETEDVSPIKSTPKRERLTRKDLIKDDKDKKEDVKEKKTEKSEKEEETNKKAVKKEEIKKETKKDEPKKDTKKEEQKKDNKKDEMKKDTKKEEAKKEIKKEEPKKDIKKDDTPVLKKGRAIKKEKEEIKEKKDDQKKESDDEKDDSSEKGEQKKVSRRRSMRKDEIKKEIVEDEEVKNNEIPEKEIKPKVKSAVKKEEKKDDKPTKVLTKKEGKTDDDKKAKQEPVTKKPKMDENKKSKPEKVEKVDIDNKKTKAELKDLDKSKSKPIEEAMDVERYCLNVIKIHKYDIVMPLYMYLSLLFNSTEETKVNNNRVSKEYPQGTKLKVLYGRGKNQKIYEAKIIEASREGGLQYLVHYAGWNNRYDEWIKPERIVRVLDKPEVKAVKPITKTPKVTQQPVVRGRARSLTPKGVVTASTESAKPSTTQNMESDVKIQNCESRPAPVNQVQQNRESRAPTKQISTSSSPLPFPSMGVTPHQQPSVNLKPMSASSIQSHISSDVKPVTTASSPLSLITESNSCSIDTSQTDSIDHVPSSTTLPKTKAMTDGSNASPNRQGIDNTSTFKSKSPATKPGKPRSTRSNSTDLSVMDGLPPKQRKSKRSTGGQSDTTLTGSESDDNDQSDTDIDVSKDQTTVTDGLMEEISQGDNLNTTIECMNKSLDKIHNDIPSKDSDKSDDSMRNDMPKLSPVSIPVQLMENDNAKSPSSFKDNIKDDKKFDKMAKISLVKMEVNSSPSKEVEKKAGSEISDIIHRKIEAEVSKEIDNSSNSESADLKDSELCSDSDKGVSENNVINKTVEDVKSPPKLYNLSNNEKPILKKEMVPVIDDRFEFKDDSDEDLPLPDLRAEIHLEKERIKLECENEKKKEKSKKPLKEKKEVKETKRMRTLAERKIGPPNLLYVEYGFFEPPNKKLKEDDEKPAKDGDSNAAKSEDSYSSSESQDIKNHDCSDVKEENEMEKKKVKKKVKKKKEVSESSVNSELETKKEIKGAKTKVEKSATKSKGNKKNKEAVPTATAAAPELEEEQVLNDSANVSADKVSDNELAQSHVTSESKAVIHSSEPSSNEPVQISSLTMEVTNENSAKVSCSDSSSKLISDNKVENHLLMDNTPPTTPEHQIEDSSCSSQEKSHEPIKLPEISHLHEQHYGGESPAGNASPSSNDGSVGSGNVACSESSSNDTPIATTIVKRRRESDEPTPSKKKRKGRHKTSTDKKNTKQQGSDSDEAYNTDHRFSPEPVGSMGKMSGSHSPRPPKFNLNLEEGQYLEGEQRISFLMEKIQEIRKVYMNLKSEVATIDRRRKRARRRERESAHSSSNAEGEFVR